jgi:hypothetical protein
MGRDGRLERIGIVLATLLWVLLSGCASTPSGDPDPLEALGREPLDCSMVEAGYFFIPSASNGRVYPSLSDRIRGLGYDGSRDVRRRSRLVSGDGWTREITEGYEGVGLKYRDPACRHRIGRRGGGGVDGGD